jgi:hypothetical protein
VFRARQEGRFAIVTNVGRGMRWAYRVAAWFIRTPTNNTDMHGEVVWSWRRDAGAKFAMMRFARRTDDGGKKARSPGDHV